LRDAQLVALADHVASGLERLEDRARHLDERAEQLAVRGEEVALAPVLEVDERRDAAVRRDRHAQDRARLERAHRREVAEERIVERVREQHRLARPDHALEQPAAELPALALEVARLEAVEHAVLELALL